MRPIPITLVSGWLGSGKTTFLNHLLTDAISSGRRIAVLQNEFGDIGLDGALLEGAIAGLYELSSGCLCCTVHDDFMALIEEILRMEEPPEAIVVETTGVADPSVPLVSLLQHADYDETFHVDGVITLVDATDFLAAEREHPEVPQQIAAADLLLINKCDQVPAGRVAELRARLRQLNRQATILEASHGHPRDSSLDPLDLGGLDPNRTSLGSAEVAGEGGAHTEGIGSLSIAESVPFDQERLYKALEDIFTEFGDRIYRAKGIFRLAGVENELVVQGVRSRYSWQFRAARSSGPDSHVVFIGRDLPPNLIETRLRGASRTSDV